LLAEEKPAYQIQFKELFKAIEKIAQQ